MQSYVYSLMCSQFKSNAKLAFIRICKVCLRKYRCNNLTTMDNVGFTQICIHIYRTVNRCGNFYIFIQRKIGICLYGYLVIIGTPDEKYIDGIIETLGLANKLQNLPNNLSGGQQQRVAIARALASKPAIILADEPTGNLDSKTSQDVLGLLKITSQKFSQTMVMITHNEEIAQLADRIIRIEDGRIVTRSGE